MYRLLKYCSLSSRSDRVLESIISVFVVNSSINLIAYWEPPKDGVFIFPLLSRWKISKGCFAKPKVYLQLLFLPSKVHKIHILLASHQAFAVPHWNASFLNFVIDSHGFISRFDCCLHWELSYACEERSVVQSARSVCNTRHVVWLCRLWVRPPCVRGTGTLFIWQSKLN